nr:hypothetical protein GCM10020093_036930 [Planobispora longispora]
MQIGEILDLGDRHQPGQAGAEGQAEYGLLVQEGVEHPARAEALLQAPGDAVDAALAGDVLAEDQHVGVGGQGVGQGPVDRLGEGEQALVLGQAPAERLLPGGGGDRAGRGDGLRGPGASGSMMSAAEVRRGRRELSMAILSTCSRVVS